MTVTHMSHRDASVTLLERHAYVTSPSVRSPRPDPTRPITTTGLSLSSMTSGSWGDDRDKRMGAFGAESRGVR